MNTVDELKRFKKSQRNINIYNKYGFNKSPKKEKIQQQGLSKKYTKWRNRAREQYLNKMAGNNELHIYFYVAKFKNENEAFIKVGVTVDIENRFKSCPYNVKVLFKVIMRTDEAFDYESSIINLLLKRNLKYNPEIKFGGATECFKTASLIVMQKSLNKRHDAIYTL